MSAKEKAISYFEKAALQNHVKSMYYLGDWYAYHGKNENKAIAYWEKAAQMGSVESMRELGRLYLQNGLNMHSIDYEKKEKGYSWLEIASQSGDLDAQVLLGNCYFMDEKDDKALEWWLKAATKGYCRAYEALGSYYSGSIRGKAIDYCRAIEWYEKAAAVKTYEGRSARSILVNIYYKIEGHKNLDRAKYWCEVMIKDGCRNQIDNEILNNLEL